MQRRARPASAGFTMVEMMVVTLILCILAAVAMTMFSRQVKRSKTVEATSNIAKIYQGQVAYVFDAQDRALASSFVNASPCPAAAPGPARYPANVTLWASSPEWAAISFSLDRAHYYQYSSPGGAGGFTARAVGDLDGDLDRATFERYGVITSGGEVQASEVSITSELE